MAIIAGVIGRSASDSSTSTTQQNVTAQPQVVRPTVPPPSFRIYKFRVDGHTAIVVPINTSDEQLKSLLWFFRENVRSHKFKDIGLTQADAEQRKGQGYFSVYRGEKCATELDFLVSARPCGSGDHDDARYQWGIQGEPNRDWGAIRTNGQLTEIFNYYKDGWQVAPEIQAQLAQQAKAEQEQAKAEQEPSTSPQFLLGKGCVPLTHTVKVATLGFTKLTRPRGLPKYAEMVQDTTLCGLDCALEIFTRRNAHLPILPG